MKSNIIPEILKKSMFVHCEDERKVWNDLNSDLYLLNETEKRLFDLLIEYPSHRSQSLVDEFGIDVVLSLYKKGVLVPFDLQEQNLFKLRRVVIEIVSNCNCSCVYCPQSIQPKPRGIMSDDLFKTILTKLQPEKPDWITLAHYGESLLDPNFCNKIKMLKDFGHQFLLLSNATLLHEKMIEFLEESPIYSAYFNFPSLKQMEWAMFMGISNKRFSATRDAIARFISRFSGKIKEIGIIVNATTADQAQRVKEIQEYFSRFGDIIVIKCPSNSRAGSIENTYIETCYHTDERFYGCDYVASLLHISIKGKCYLCCHDYDQKIELGDFLTQSLSEIMQSEKMNDIRAQIYGSKPASDELLCRHCTRIRRKL